MTFRWVAIGLTGAALLASTGAAHAVPRYSARYGQRCQLCHQDPSGGGMRSTYASEYLLPAEIAMRPSFDEGAERIERALTRSVILGADMRTLAAYSREHKEENNFFQMQGDVYLHVQMEPRFAAYVERGISGSYELFGTASILPANGYLKVGRFAPAYGWRRPDHTAFTRATLGYFTPPAHTDVGIELGLFPFNTSLNFSVLNGAPGRLRDSDGARAYVFRAEKRVRAGPLRAAIGGSLLEDAPTSVADWTAGPFASLAWGPLAWIGECDWQRAAGGTGITSFAVSHEVSGRLARGIDLLATYDLHDPDIDRKSGAHRRIGVGLDALPLPFIGLLGMVYFHDFDEGGAFMGKDDAEALLVVHFFY